MAGRQFAGVSPLVGLLVAMASPALASPPHAPPDKTAQSASLAPAAPALPYGDALILVRSALIALQQAAETDDYDVLQRLGSASFQQANPPTRLREMFAPLRAYNLASVLVLDPRFAELPHLTPQHMLAMAGAFDIQGKSLRFTLIYQPEGGRWRLFGIGASVN